MRSVLENYAHEEDPIEAFKRRQAQLAQVLITFSFSLSDVIFSGVCSYFMNIFAHPGRRTETFGACATEETGTFIRYHRRSFLFSEAAVRTRPAHTHLRQSHLDCDQPLRNEGHSQKGGRCMWAGGENGSRRTCVEKHPIGYTEGMLPCYKGWDRSERLQKTFHSCGRWHFLDSRHTDMVPSCMISLIRTCFRVVGLVPVHFYGSLISARAKNCIAPHELKN